MISRYVVLGTLILLVVLTVLSALIVFAMDWVRGWMRRNRERRNSED